MTVSCSSDRPIPSAIPSCSPTSRSGKPSPAKRLTSCPTHGRSLSGRHSERGAFLALRLPTRGSSQNTCDRAGVAFVATRGEFLLQIFHQRGAPPARVDLLFLSWTRRKGVRPELNMRRPQRRGRSVLPMNSRGWPNPPDFFSFSHFARPSAVW